MKIQRRKLIGQSDFFQTNLNAQAKPLWRRQKPFNNFQSPARSSATRSNSPISQGERAPIYL
jgi:hypothetical protein